MRRALLIAVLFSGSYLAAQQPSLQVVEVDPPQATILSGQDYVSARVTYSSPVECVIWVRPYFGGKEVNKGFSHPSPVYGSGTGEAFGWFQINTPQSVDAIHVKMVERSSQRVLAETDYPIELTFSGDPGSSRERAAWAVQLNAAQQQHFHDQARQAASQPTGAGTALFGFGFMVVVIGIFASMFAWPAYAIYKWNGWWRYAAVLPLLVIATVVLRILVDTHRDPTSHNLWPFEIVMFGGGGLIFMAALNIARRFLGQTA